MAIAYVQENAANLTSAATTVSVTLSSNVTAGDVIHVVTINNYNAESVPTISDQTNGTGGSNTYTQRGSALHVGASFQLAQFTATIGTSGSLVITANQGGSQNQFLIWAREISGSSGYDNSGSAAQVSPGGGNDILTTGNITASKTPGLVSAFCFNLENNVSNSINAGTINSPTLVTSSAGGGPNIGGVFSTEWALYSTSPAPGSFSLSSGGTNTYGTLAILFDSSGTSITAVGASSSAGAALAQGAGSLVATGASGSYGVALAAVQQLLGAGGWSTGVASLTNANASAPFSSVGASGSIGVASIAAAGAPSSVGYSGSVGVALVIGIPGMQAVGYSSSNGVVAIASFNPNSLQAKGRSGAMGTAFLQTIPIPPPPACVNLWSADGRSGWSADGYPGWSADGYEPTPLECAVTYFAEVGVNVGVLTYTCSNYGVPNGWVITGYVPFINTALAGQYIPLAISSGPCPAPTLRTVPNVIGQYYYDAQLAILGAGCEIAPAVWGFAPPPGGVNPQFVYAQSPAAGYQSTSPIQVTINVEGFPIISSTGVIEPEP